MPRVAPQVAAREFRRIHRADPAFRIPLLAGLFLLFFSMAAHASQPGMIRPMEVSRFPSLESAIRIKGPVYFCGEQVPLHRTEIRERLEKELLLMLWTGRRSSCGSSVQADIFRISRMP